MNFHFTNEQDVLQIVGSYADAAFPQYVVLQKEKVMKSIQTILMFCF